MNGSVAGTTYTPEMTRGRRRRVRLALLAGAGVVTVGLTGAGLAGQLPFVPGPLAGQGGMCARTLSAEADLSQLPEGERFDPRNPAAACSTYWDRMWDDGTPRPKSFAACYHRTSDGNPKGGAVVFPADGYPSAEAACTAIGFISIKPTTN